MIKRAWHWMAGRVTMRPRRITVVAWSLIFLFSRGIDRVLRHYAQPAMRVDEWLIALLAAGIIPLFAYAWIRGRPARKARRRMSKGNKESPA